ncbi:biopolymer transporter ExbD [Halomonas sp. MCCC 1A17488]|uniref:Biopolymer transporter ExbD n=1 Tax=Billgrantia sulfidoxydans TaxID=2733484 RepID=A0ABX7W2C2_9GAMM|nr:MULTISPECIES: biopolymer transporter ExbD [Halomonas]MCE8015679.1 biopolymer transporter ExbD [Halomonas sp. MCCC 1A17488]MCG3239012.1 biopolymer transporter ExbD [Halomonas sp. MCCC 1A17488]QPP51037.1 biopolymer transporter ExbD [Halomonas sp. SS10-MC5]QTP54549.1 biopolymer transporter ExbD [Halomonas sulfidoxydans]
MKFTRRRRDPVEVNLTPLIDVVFLLLIFFMVSTTFETRQALELTLPESTAGVDLEVSPVTLTVTAQGGYRLGEREFDADELGEALSTEAEQARLHGLVIEADARAVHADVVRALDQAGGLGIRQVRIATRETQATSTQAETP